MQGDHLSHARTFSYVLPLLSLRGLITRRASLGRANFMPNTLVGAIAILLVEKCGGTSFTISERYLSKWTSECDSTQFSHTIA